MYDYDYEENVLLVLRLLKFLHMTNPWALKEVLQRHNKLDPDFLDDLACDTFYSLFKDCMSVYDEEQEMEVLHITHPLLDRFLHLAEEISSVEGRSVGLYRQKLRDIVEYFTTARGHSVFDLKYIWLAGQVALQITLSPDCYEPLLLTNAFVDLLLYVQRENKVLEEILAGKLGAEIGGGACAPHKEEAA